MVRIICSTDPKGKTIVTGFQGLGYVGAMSVDHLIEVLNARRVGYVDTTHMPPIALVKDGGLRFPYEIYEHNDLLLFRFENLPMGRAVAIITHELVKWAKEVGIRRIIAIGGLNQNFKEDEGDLVRYAANETYERIYGDVKPKVQDGIQIVGPLALILNYSDMFEMPALALLSYASPDRVDPRGAANALLALSDLLNIEVSVDELLERAVRVEEGIKTAINLAREKEERGPGMYA